MKGQVYEVVSPLGEPTMEVGAIAPRLSDLRGQTICEIWNGGFGGQVSFPIIEDMLRQRYPDIKILPYTDFPLSTVRTMEPATKAETLAAVTAALKKRGCSAVITGNGG